MNRTTSRVQSAQLAAARRLLKRRADHGGELAVADGIDAGMAFWVIEGLQPPLPPAGPVDHLPVPSLDEVRTALRAAAEAATSVEEATAIAHAALELAGEGLTPDGDEGL
jgi:hypothetical protein